MTVQYGVVLSLLVKRSKRTVEISLGHRRQCFHRLLFATEKPAHIPKRKLFQSYFIEGVKFVFYKLFSHLQFFLQPNKTTQLVSEKRSINRSTFTHLYLQPKNFRYLLISLLCLSCGFILRSFFFRIRLQE